MHTYVHTRAWHATDMPAFLRMSANTRVHESHAYLPSTQQFYALRINTNLDSNSMAPCHTHTGSGGGGLTHVHDDDVSAMRHHHHHYIWVHKSIDVARYRHTHTLTQRVIIQTALCAVLWPREYNALHNLEM